MSIDTRDEFLIQSFKAGDHEAFTEVVVEHRAALLRQAYRRLHDAAAAEDAVQETFVRAYRSFDRLHDDSRVGAWLHHICNNVCIDEANRRCREQDKAARFGVDRSWARVDWPAIDEQLGLDIDTTPAESALGSLSREHREAFTLRYVDEMPYSEIAERSGTSEQNIRARASRARTALRTALRSACALPVAFVTFGRRGSRAAAALERAESAERAGSQAGLAASRFAQLAPAIDTASAAVVQGQHVAPVLTKAAIGIGAITVAVVTATSGGSSEPMSAPPAPTVAVVAPVVDEAPVAAAPLTVAPAPVPATGAGAPTVLVDIESTLPATSAAPEAVPTETVPATVAPTTAPATTPTAPPSTEPPATTPPTEPPPTTPQPPAPQGGSVSVGALMATPAGPRVDVAGSVSLTVGGSTMSGSLSGRLAIGSEVDASGRQRLEGVLTLSVDGTAVEIRLNGHAVGLDGGDDVPASSFSVSGMFRASGGESVGLVGQGSFSGSFGSSLSLSLSP